MLHDAMERERGNAQEIYFIIRKRNLSSVGHLATIVLEENDGMTLMLQLDNLEKKTVKF